MAVKLCVFLMVIVGIIIFTVSFSYIPSQGGTIPPGVDPDEYKKQQQQVALHSDAFKVAMGGLCLTLLTMVYIAFRQREAVVEPKPKSILKVTRFAILPS